MNKEKTVFTVITGQYDEKKYTESDKMHTTKALAFNKAAASLILCCDNIINTCEALAKREDETGEDHSAELAGYFAAVNEIHKTVKDLIGKTKEEVDKLS